MNLREVGLVTRTGEGRNGLRIVHSGGLWYVSPSGSAEMRNVTQNET